jgi:type IV pilus assembly protein PilN
LIAVDLLPPDEARAAAARRRTRRLGALGVAVAVAGLIVGHGLLAFATAVTGHEIARAERERSALERPVAVLRRLRQRQASLRSRLAVLARLEARGSEPGRVLAALASCAPAGLWLTAVKLAGGRLELAGVAADDRTIADFVARLHRDGALRGLDLEDATRDDAPAPPVRRFVIAGAVGAGS